MRVLLIDDEKLALDMLESLLNKIDGIEIVGKYQNPESALQNIKEKQVDVIFLDINMGSTHGIKFAEKITAVLDNIEIIFVTAYPQFALDAFEVDAMDYLLKPVNFNRLNKAILKARKRIEIYKLKNTSTVQPRESLHAYTMSKFRLIDFQHNPVKWRTKKVKELFIYLWHNKDNPVHKAKIIEELWPNMDAGKAMVLLHTTIYQLRKTLKETGIEKPVTLLNDQYVLSFPFSSDVQELQELVESDAVNSENVARVLDLYTGDYLEEEGYSWAIQQQLTLRESLICYLDHFITDSIHKQKNNHLVEASLEKLLQLDTYNETYMFKLMTYYKEQNNFQKLQTLYEEIKNTFEVDLGIEVPSDLEDLFNNYLYMLKPLNS
ncbi:response regulator [Cytobacillus praedii]|uniref:response regulator n=1 Tax=Cytobacillus praedii TaxID=1742358 RepID=UPI003AF6E5E1